MCPSSYIRSSCSFWGRISTRYLISSGFCSSSCMRFYLGSMMGSNFPTYLIYLSSRRKMSESSRISSEELVAKIIPLQAKFSEKRFLWIIFLILGSSAERQLSKMRIYASEYKALAKAILAFCPPLKLAPPISMGVSFPWGKASMSFCKQHIFTPISNFFRSNGFPKRMFSLTVLLNKMGSCGAYPKVPFRFSTL